MIGTALTGNVRKVGEVGMRLIDADALKEKKVYSLERHEKIVPVAEIDWMPTIDAVSVVRCKDCKYYSGAKDKQGDYTAIGYCNHTSHHIMPLRYDFYCADGERRANAQTD